MLEENKKTNRLKIAITSLAVLILLGLVVFSIFYYLSKRVPDNENKSDFLQKSELDSTYKDGSKDQDRDGLLDYREKYYNTDPLNPDTDGDDLSDGEEVMIYFTDPTKDDSDGDTYYDGEEVRRGYNPNGSGRAE